MPPKKKPRVEGALEGEGESESDSTPSSVTSLKLSASKATTNQIGQLFQAGIEREGTIFHVEKSVKTYDEMISILKSASCNDCENLEQSVRDVCLDICRIINRETPTHQDRALDDFKGYVESLPQPLSDGYAKTVTSAMIRTIQRCFCPAHLTKGRELLPFSPGRGEFGSINMKCRLHNDCMETSTRIVGIPDVIAYFSDVKEILYVHENKKKEWYSFNQLVLNMIGQLLQQPNRSCKWLCGAFCAGDLTDVKISLVMGCVGDNKLSLIYSKEPSCEWGDLVLFQWLSFIQQCRTQTQDHSH